MDQVILTYSFQNMITIWVMVIALMLFLTVLAQVMQKVTKPNDES